MGLKKVNEILNKGFFSIQETASYLCMSEGSIRTLINSGLLPKIQINKRCKIYIDFNDIQRFIIEHKKRVDY